MIHVVDRLVDYRVMQAREAVMNAELTDYRVMQAREAVIHVVD